MLRINKASEIRVNPNPTIASPIFINKQLIETAPNRSVIIPNIIHPIILAILIIILLIVI